QLAAQILPWLNGSTHATRTVGEPLAPPRAAPSAFVPLFGKVARLVWRVECNGVEHIPAAGAFILCPNHQSALDHLWIAACLSSSQLRRLTWVVKREAFESALSRAVIQSLARHAAIAIERDGDPEPALRQSLRVLQAGQPLVIYPEGTRTLTGQLGEFQLGAAWLALATHAPLVPVRIAGAFEIFKAGQRIPRVFDWQQRTRPRVRVTFAEPLSPPADAKGRAAELALTQRLRAAIEQQ
ncbi:MAG: lysophospholipid acyltransferase family protein, partial [Chloroflexota bacterium]